MSKLPSTSQVNTAEVRDIEHITVRELETLVPRLGIPHFQRGLVWNTSSTSALLESLYWDTPCGGFVFWRPSSLAEYGDPLQGPGDGLEYLIVDGQQRIRCLYGALFGGDDGGEAGGEREDERPDCDEQDSKRVWCLNLTRVPELQRYVEPLPKEYALFVYTADPLEADKRSPLRRSLVPLARLLAGEEVERYEARSFRNGVDQKEARLALKQAYSRARSILDRKFFRVVRTDDVQEIVRAYNRINSGGLRVEAEERAFARLVSLDRDTYKQIAAIFRDVHGETATAASSRREVHGGTAALRRDDVMKRRRERNLGFKAFLRTFVQACNHHFDRSAGSRGFSFGILESDQFARRVGDECSNALAPLWEDTRRCLLKARQILEDRLFCDELAFLPEVTSLAPFFQLLLQFDFDDKRFDPILSWLLLALVLRNPASQREWLTQVGRVRKERENGLTALVGLAREADHKARGALDDDKTLREANSIQNRYVLLLYWLVRWKGAQDFSYENAPALRGQAPRPVCKEHHPEKQHIVPFSKLKDVYGEGAVRRGSSHPVNNIGNFTYISDALNGLDGLGDKLIKLEHDDWEVLEKHFLWEKRPDGERVQVCYPELKGLLEHGQGPTEAASAKSAQSVKNKYESFCRARRSLIRDGFLAWLDALRIEALGSLGANSEDELEEAVRRSRVVSPRRQLATPPRRAESSHNSGGKRRRIAEEEFLTALNAKCGRDAVELFRSLSGEWQGLSLRAVRRDASFVFRMRSPIGHSKFLTMLHVGKDGGVWFHSLPDQLRKVGLPERIGKEYFLTVGELFPARSSRENKQVMFTIGRLEVIAPRREAFRGLLQQTMQGITEAARQVRSD